MAKKTNKRSFFVSGKVKLWFTFYVIFSLVIVSLFLGWDTILHIVLPYIQDQNMLLQTSQGFPSIIKIVLLLLWGMFSFLLSYTYLDVKFLKIFQRIDTLFKNINKNDKLVLEFRHSDNFDFLADSFNAMKDMFITRIEKRKQTIEDVNRRMQELPENPTEEDVQAIVKIIDEELQH